MECSLRLALARESAGAPVAESTIAATKGAVAG
jgi:hypothetical protein